MAYLCYNKNKLINTWRTTDVLRNKLSGNTDFNLSVKVFLQMIHYISLLLVSI